MRQRDARLLDAGWTLLVLSRPVLLLDTVNAFAEILLQRFHQPRMMAEDAERLVVGVGGEGGARRAGLLAPHLLAVAAVNLLGLRAQHGDFFLAEAIGEEEIALVVEILELLRAELHGRPPASSFFGFLAASVAGAGGKATSAPNPKFAHTLPQGRLRTSESGH